MMSIRPLHKNVLLEILEIEKVSSSGILLSTGKQKELINKAKVIAISSEIPNSLIAINDLVYVKEYTGSDLDFEDKKCRLIEYKDILAVIEKSENN